MREIEVRIKEVDKSQQPFTLHNFRDELVNFMYKKTVADSTRVSMRFYILMFFLSVQIDSKSLLRKLFDDNIDKLKKLNKEFETHSKLKKDEYSRLVREARLTQVFKNDIIFLLIRSILDSNEVLEKFSNFFGKNKDLKDEFKVIIKKYGGELEKFDLNFKSHLIADNRIDDFGNSHDLSKSVYRTIQMRTSRQLDLTLHKYADVKIIKSQSPIDLTIIQHIDFRIVVDLWTSYGLGEYVKSVWSFGADFGAQPYIAAKTIQYLVKKWIAWKSINGRKERTKKLKAKKEFEEGLTKSKKNPQITTLVEVLVQSVVKSNVFLREEISSLRGQIEKLAQSRTITNKKDVDTRIKELEKKVERLENIKIRTKETRSEK